MLFPEGTSSDGQRVLPFKSALFGVFFAASISRAPVVQPVTIAYRARQGLPADFYGWWGEMDFGAHLASVLALSRGGEVEVRFHPALRAADFADRKALAGGPAPRWRKGSARRGRKDGSGAATSPSGAATAQVRHAANAAISAVSAACSPATSAALSPSAMPLTAIRRSDVEPMIGANR